ncbi:unnamed protein product [Meganyctiphanes norvegica]|uniref:RRM domain-containing protein n=1 Tax=Meganyctiphanes norvegica TaxID=48144 RepID=A0AAV2QTA4_MEGNR
MEDKKIIKSIIIESSESEDSSVYGITKSDTKRFWNKIKRNVSYDCHDFLNVERGDSISTNEYQTDSALGSSDKESSPQANISVSNTDSPMVSTNKPSSVKIDHSKHDYISNHISNEGYFKNVSGSSHKRKSSSSTRSRSRSTLHSQQRKRRRHQSTSSESSSHGYLKNMKILEDSNSQIKSSFRTPRDHSRDNNRRTDSKEIESCKSQNKLKSVIGVVKTNRISHSEVYNKEGQRNRYVNGNTDHSSSSSRQHIRTKEHPTSHPSDKSKSIYQHGFRHDEKINISKKNDNIQKRYSSCSFIKYSKDSVENCKNSHADQIRNYSKSYRNSSPENRILPNSKSFDSHNNVLNVQQSCHEHHSRHGKDHIRNFNHHQTHDTPVVTKREHIQEHSLFVSKSHYSTESIMRPSSDLQKMKRRPPLLPTPPGGPSQTTCCCSFIFNQDLNIITRKMVSPVPRQQQQVIQAVFPPSRKVVGPVPRQQLQVTHQTVGGCDWNLACKVYVGGLSQDVTRQQLKHAFIKFGHVRNLWLAKNPPGFGFVEFETEEEARAAVREDGRLRVGGAVVKVEMSWTPFPGKKTERDLK